MKTVYLAGPIVGCNHAEANDWRKDFAARLKDCGITGVSPLRCEPLVGDTYPASNGDPRFGTARAIGSKNVYDVRTCDMGVIYLSKGFGM
jgi:nucleoside 2-deoxyribosyltransferase